MSKPLDGVTVADFSQLMQGPWATQKLGDMGANVIKIEPVGGEWMRRQAVGGEFIDGVSPWFLSMNRNKRSIALDLKDERGHEIARDIITSSDVMIENFRPGVMDRLDLGYEDVTEINPNIVYVSSTGWGGDGPYSDRPGQDLLIQALSGITMNAGRKDDPPIPAGTFIADQLAAMNIALHTMIALFHEQQTGEGQHVEVNMFNSLLDALCEEITAVLNMDKEFSKSEEGVAHPFLDEPYGIYETTDGYVALAVFTPDDMKDLRTTLDLPELEQYESRIAAYENRDTVKRLVQEQTRQYNTESLLSLFSEEDIWASKVTDINDIEDNSQAQYNDMITELDYPDVGSYKTTNIPVAFSKTPGEIVSSPPQSGEHTEEILSELGWDDRLQELLQDDVVEVSEN